MNTRHTLHNMLCATFFTSIALFSPNASADKESITLSFKASSTYYQGPAKMQVKQSDKNISKVLTVYSGKKSKDWRQYTFKLPRKSKVDVRFLNDLYKGKYKDRNLHIKNIKVNNQSIPQKNLIFSHCKETAVRPKGIYDICHGKMTIKLYSLLSEPKQPPKQPPAQKPKNPPITPKPKPPIAKPPIIEPPVKAPPVKQPPVVKQPVTPKPQPPVTTPPVTAPPTNTKVTKEHCITFMHKFGYGPTGNDVQKYCDKNPLQGMRQWYADARKPMMANYNPAASNTVKYLRRYYELSDKKDSSQFPFAAAQGSEEIVNRIMTNVMSPAQVTERLNSFWSNHFSVYRQKSALMKGLSAQMEKDAIRPHIYGKFEDMLVAVAKHPAMIIYLDNNISIGPNSVEGKKRGKGLNENLAREILELHTLGVKGGYTQRDVVELAKVLTGWSFNRNGFLFVKEKHEPGVKTILGQRFFINTPNTNEALVKEGERVLRFIANHRSTAEFVSMKLARHFLSDDANRLAGNVSPRRLADVYMQGKTRLTSLYDTMAVAAMQNVTTYPKYKLPYDMYIGVMRMHKNNSAKNLLSKKVILERKLRSLSDYHLWNWKAPDGWPDNAAYWKTPSNILRAAEWCPSYIGTLYASEKNPAATWDSVYHNGFKEYSQMMRSNAFSEKEKLGLVCLSQLQMNR